MQQNKDLFYDTLYEKLDPRSGKLQSTDNLNEIYWKTVLDIGWKGGIHFIVSRSLFRNGRAVYYVMRDNQLLSPQYHTSKTSEELVRYMQHIIDDIENGKFRNRKTMSEKIRAAVEEKGLVSYMNDTKWRELFDAVSEKLPDICLQYKTIFEEDDPEIYWDIGGDEHIRYMNKAEIEWLRIQSYQVESTRVGLLLPKKREVYDKKDEILQILNEYSIPYEYDENEQVFIVYGYK